MERKFQMRSLRQIFAYVPVFLLFASVSTFGGEPDPVTVAVKNALKTLYPDGEVVKIDKERKAGVRRFEATVRDKSGEHTLVLRSDGSVVESSNEIARDSLPKAVKEKLAKYFPASKILLAFKNQRNGQVFYRVTIDAPKTLFFTEDGSEVAEPKVK